MKRKILFVVSLLFGLMFINAGLNKFFNYMPVPDDLPEDVITNKYRALGALIIFPVMIGILLTHIITEPSGLPIALILFAILVWAMVENREKYLPLIR